MATTRGFSAFVSMSAFAGNFYTGCAELKMCWLHETSFLVQINCDMIRSCALLLWPLLQLLFGRILVWRLVRSAFNPGMSHTKTLHTATAAW